MKPLPPQAIPSCGLLAHYLAFAAPLTDASPSYHLAVGLTVIATLLGNRVMIPFGPRPLYPNLYVTLLGRSTFSRKTTSIAIGERVLERFEGVQILPAEFSPEAFLERLSKAPTALAIYPEFARALAAFRKADYMAGMIERLTELYDCPPRYVRELRGKTFTIERPVLSMLAGSTLEWLQRQMGEDDIQAGFFPRFLFVPEAEKPAPLAIPPTPDLKRENQIVQGFHQLQALQGAASLERIRERYERWYFRVQAEVYARADGEALNAFAGRLTVTALKLALLYNVAEDPSSLVISPEALERALALVGWLREAQAWLLDEGFVWSRWEKDKGRVLRLIRQRPGIPWSDLLRLSHLKARDLREIVETMGQAGLIEVTPNDGVNHYYAR